MTPMIMLTLVIGWIAVAFLAVLGLVVLWRIVDGTINLTLLISEEDGSASISRFQLLIFTFVIAMSLLLIVVSAEQPAFPEIPAGVFSLLGISASTYAVAKGIQLAHDANPNVLATRQMEAQAQVKAAEAKLAEIRLVESKMSAAQTVGSQPPHPTQPVEASNRTTVNGNP